MGGSFTQRPRERQQAAADSRQQRHQGCLKPRGLQHRLFSVLLANPYLLEPTEVPQVPIFFRPFRMRPEVGRRHALCLAAAGLAGPLSARCAHSASIACPTMRPDQSGCISSFSGAPPNQYMAPLRYSGTAENAWSRVSATLRRAVYEPLVNASYSPSSQPQS